MKPKKIENIKDLIKYRYYGSYRDAAKASGRTVEVLRQWVSQGRTVMELSDGSFVLKSKQTVIFN